MGNIKLFFCLLNACDITDLLWIQAEQFNYKATDWKTVTFHTCQHSHCILIILTTVVKPGHLHVVKLVPTPMLSVMVCPSLKPKSSFGPESPSWALLLNSVSCFTHLQWRRDRHQHSYRNKQCISAVFRKNYSMQLSVSAVHLKDSILFSITKAARSPLTWNGPAKPRWNRKRPLGPRSQLQWKHCDLQTGDTWRSLNPHVERRFRAFKQSN